MGRPKKKSRKPITFPGAITLRFKDANTLSIDIKMGGSEHNKACVEWADAARVAIAEEEKEARYIKD